MLGLTELEGRTVTDIGCGDGTFTMRYWDRGKPRMMSALDPAVKAVVSASIKSRGRPINFIAADGHHLPYADDAFDVAILQAILHHDSDPAATIREAFRVARELVVLEPNGYSPMLKLMERLSPYHRDPEERAYPSPPLRPCAAAAGARVPKGRVAIHV